MTLSLILRFNLRLGVTPYGARVHRAPYLKEGFGARAPHSLGTTVRVLGRLLEALKGLQKYSKHSRKHLQKHSTPVELDYEELRGLSDLGQRDCSRAWNILK